MNAPALATSAPEKVEKLLSDEAFAKIDRELEKYPSDRKQSAVIAALAIAQEEIGWVSASVIEAVAQYLEMPPIAVQEVATFYNLFFTEEPRGQHTLSICTGLPCALRSAAKAGAYLQQVLGVRYGETTADGCFTLKESECLGACGTAPVLLLNNKKVFDFMGTDCLDKLLSDLRTQARIPSGERSVDQPQD